ncbi:recombinase family protein, partial [Hymenobacter coccineus]|uniref:recombinase family protein n=1 Tax=Hymenobacter coccineus TaxID=1908235 RepID=UPI000A52E499
EGALATLKYLKELASHGVAYKSFTEPYLDSLGPFGDVIVSMLATIAAQDLIKIRENTKAALDKKRAAGIELGPPPKARNSSTRCAGSRPAWPRTRSSAGP